MGGRLGALRISYSLFLLAPLVGCAAEQLDGPPDGYDEGVQGDQERYSLEDKEDRPLPYEIPPPAGLVAPEIIVSLSKQTVHLFDRQTGFSRVYPTGVGKLGSSGYSITPTGHYLTSPDTNDGWYYVPARWEPSYFEGLPFLRLNIRNAAGANTYGLHGPITHPLRRGYVSHGCMRMEKPDIVELFYAVKDFASTPVSIQQEVELDANGDEVDVGVEAALYAPDAEIVFGDSIGPRPPRVVPRGFIGDSCAVDEDCGDGTPESDAFCHPSFFCTEPCTQYCPDRAGRPGTFCAATSSGTSDGLCLRRVDDTDPSCDLVPNTYPMETTNPVDGRMVLTCTPDGL